MNPAQLAQQLKHLLEQAAWPGGYAIFGTHGSVAVFAGIPTEEQIPAGAPWALVGIDSGDVDPDDPGVLTQRFTVTVAAEVAGDPMGENAIIGGAMAATTASAGRGVSEVSAQARRTLQSLTGFDGARLLVSSVSTAAPRAFGRGRHMALEELTLSAVCTSEPHYAAPQRLRYEVTKWKWDGDHCEARFDFLRYRLVRKFGSNPSVDVDDGTTLYTGTAASWTGVQNSGYTYTVFADYNSRGSALVEGTSSPEVGAYRSP